MGRLKRWLRGGSDELGWDDLRRLVVEELAPAAHHGKRGGVVFPPAMEIVVTVPDVSVDVVRAFVEKPEFDQEVGAALANRCDCAVADLPVRDYRVEPGDETAVIAVEGQPRRWELLVEGGDLSGTTLSLPPGIEELRFGRGEWHGGERQIRNDLVVCDESEFVSRRAGRILRRGNCLEVESLDQADDLVVHLANGQALRPARSASGRIAVRVGEVIEMTGGREQAIRLVVRRL